jgi:hypothetical protein
MVIITTVKAGWPSTGRSTTRSSAMPNSTMTARVGEEGQPRTAGRRAVRPTKPPTIIRSPWAKLTVSVAL